LVVSFVLFLAFAPFGFLSSGRRFLGFVLTLFALLKTLLTLYKLFAGNFHFKRLLLLIQYFVYLGGYLLTTGQIYGFSVGYPIGCPLMYINGKTPALFSGAIALLSYSVFVLSV
jgi:hypothetical protein